MSDGSLKNSYFYTIDFDRVKPQKTESFTKEMSGFTDLELSQIFIPFSQVPLINETRPNQNKVSKSEINKEKLDFIRKILESELE